MIETINNIEKERGKNMRDLRSFIREEEGMGTVEIVLIIVVLIAIVAIFKNSITSLENELLKKVTKNAKQI